MRLLVLIVFVVFALLPSALAVIVDRVAVSLGNQVITASEIQERIALTAFQNGTTPPNDAAAWKTAAEQLIDQKIVRREMLVGRYASMDTEESAALLEQYRKAHFATEKEMMEALRRGGLTADQLEADLARQADLLSFLNLRFRPAVQVTDEDSRAYYRSNIEPKNNPDQSISYDEVRVAIEETLTNQRADRELETWLKDQRKRLKIEYHAEAFPVQAGTAK